MRKPYDQTNLLVVGGSGELKPELLHRFNRLNYIVSKDCSWDGNVSLLQHQNVDCIILDKDLIPQSAIMVCRGLRQRGFMAPILVLSSTREKTDIVHMLESGADDFLREPFDFNELHARLQAIKRRYKRNFPISTLETCGLILQVDDRKVSNGLHSVDLTPTETILLSRLMQHSPKPIMRNTLFEEVWGIDNSHTSNRLDAYIRRLRMKLARIHDENLIHTVHGTGYYIGRREG